MTVLLVDDQVRILSGLISGLDWDALGVTAIRTADSAEAAKKILIDEPVDILLCDIEMPGENGLSLLRWARRKGMDFVCVFLTSHADFLYAKEAIQLNSFDYILQPARYDEIQATVARAIARVKNDNTDKELLHYGLIAKSQEASLFQNLFSDWSAGRSLSIHALQEALEKLGKHLDLESQCFVIWGHLLRWHTEPWLTQEWIYALNNIVTEVYEGICGGILPFSIDKTSLGWFVYAPGKKFTHVDRVLGALNQAYLAVSQHLPCDLAFYVSPVVPLSEINDQSSLLLDAKQNNVLRESGIFCPSRSSQRSNVEKVLDIVQLHRWEDLLKEGAGAVAFEEIQRYLNSLAKAGGLNKDSLHSFWIQFQQAIVNAAQAVHLDLKEVLTDITVGNQTSSLSETLTTVQKTIQHFPENDPFSGSEKKLVEQVRKYVMDNLDQTLNVNGVASAFYMNADYLSRVFKNETGIPLKEYIIQRKMESAHQLLTTTELPVSVIASKLGYDNFSYFSQAYRKIMGISPSDERKRV